MTRIRQGGGWSRCRPPTPEASPTPKRPEPAQPKSGPPSGSAKNAHHPRSSCRRPETAGPSLKKGRPTCDVCGGPPVPRCPSSPSGRPELQAVRFHRYVLAYESAVEPTLPARISERGVAPGERFDVTTEQTAVGILILPCRYGERCGRLHTAAAGGDIGTGMQLSGVRHRPGVLRFARGASDEERFRQTPLPGVSRHMPGRARRRVRRCSAARCRSLLDPRRRRRSSPCSGTGRQRPSLARRHRR